MKHKKASLIARNQNPGRYDLPIISQDQKRKEEIGVNNITSVCLKSELRLAPTGNDISSMTRQPTKVTSVTSIY